MSSSPKTWKERLYKVIDLACAKDPDRKLYSKANEAIIKDILFGRDPITETSVPEGGARVVVNIASVHIPGFCEATRKKEAKPYKNGYDLGKYRIGDDGPDKKLREVVDAALPLDGVSPADFYFGAVELNGAGIRFYGDICLVLKCEKILPDTIILDRNSFDLIRSPIRNRVNKDPDGVDRDEAGKDEARRREAETLAGCWKSHLGDIGSIMVFDHLGHRKRLFTTGQISSAIRSDEDYIEVLKKDSFCGRDLEGARFSAEDAACDALTGDRIGGRPVPRLEALMMRQRHRRADEELRRIGVVLSPVATSGRLKS